jgi:ABC-type Fe3+ transport system permease subunit
MSKKSWWIIGLIIALAVTLLSPLASSWPDGLERVAEDHGFINLAAGPIYEVIPDYVLPGVPNEALATILAGMIGVLVVFGLSVGAGYLIRRRESEHSTS